MVLNVHLEIEILTTILMTNRPLSEPKHTKNLKKFDNYNKSYAHFKTQIFFCHLVPFLEKKFKFFERKRNSNFSETKNKEKLKTSESCRKNWALVQ